MNVLTDGLPIAVEIDGKEYPLNADYRTAISILTAFEDPQLMAAEKQRVMLELLYPETPPDFARAAELAVKFLNCGEDSGASSEDADDTRYYSWTQDARCIMSAIEQTYQIDLSQTPMLHWWKFCYMFLDLNENCFFSKLIYLRKQKAKGKLTKEEREWYASMRSIVDLPEVYTGEEQTAIDRFMKQLRG
jgi:hypothetical protein